MATAGAPAAAASEEVGMRRFILHSGIRVILLLLLLGADLAAADDDAGTCGRALGADAITACSRLIAAGREKGSALAGLYQHRCDAWNKDHEPDRALADCSEAIRLEPSLVAARTGRGDSLRTQA